MSKFAILSDIHSNVWALEAVLSDADNRNVDGLINLGDILYGPLAPRETYDLLQTKEIITIKGNQDSLIYEATETEVSENPTMQFILSELGAEPLEWMKSLPATLSLKEDIFLCHGMPDNDLEYMLEDVSDGYPKVKSEQELSGYVRHIPKTLILCGHTHIPRAVELSDGKLIVNPGSVGLPAYCDDEPVPHKMENYSPHASYCTIEKSPNGWHVDFIKVPYDHQSAIRAATARDRRDWAYALRSGRSR